MSAKQRRQGLRMCVKREVDKISPMLTAPAPSNLAQLQQSLSKLTTYRSELKPHDDTVLQEVTDPAKIDIEILEAAQYNDSVLDVIAQINAIQRLSLLPVPGTPGQSASASSNTKSGYLRLPKLELAQFSGDPLDWQTFWDAFDSAIHQNGSLSTIDKFNYLRGLLVGDDLKAVEGFRLTAANYDAVISTLRERFGDKLLAIFSHMEAMLALPQASSEIGNLQSVADSCERHIRSLSALGLHEEQFGQVFTPMMLSKLPKQVKIELHRKNGSQNWTLKHLREWLKDDIRARDMGELAFPEHSGDTKTHGRKHGEGNGIGSGGGSKQNNRSNSRTALVVTTSALVSNAGSGGAIKCAFCAGDHYSDSCSKFPDVRSRRPHIQNRCFNCLGQGHQASQCQRAVPCAHCKRSGHHRSLCFRKFGDKRGKPKNSQSKTSGSQRSSVEHSTVAVTHIQKRTVLQTAITTVSNEDTGVKISARLLFDSAGSRTFITQQKCIELGLVPVDEELISVSTFESTKRKTVRYKVVQFTVHCIDGSTQSITASVVPCITSPIQKIPIDASKLRSLSKMPLAEPLVAAAEFVTVDILIGLDYYYEFIHCGRVFVPGGPLFLESRVGYVAAGRVASNAAGCETIALMLLDSMAKAPAETSFCVEKHWSLEEIGMKESPNQLSTDDEALMQHSSLLKQDVDGRYTSRWPWKCENPDLADNSGMAHGRLARLMKRLIRTPRLLQAYSQTIQGQLEKGVIEEVPSGEPSGPVYYMPHHCVETPSKTTTKLRVVYDASSKTAKSDQSLNDCLHRGPILLEDLCSLLLRFRGHRIAFVSDIEKAFLQIGLQLQDRDATRFIWVHDVYKPPTGDNLVYYRFCRVPFGIIYSPFVLENTVCQHLKKWDSDVSMKILGDHYVDNVITGEDTVDAAIANYRESKSIFGSAKMNLREWFTNNNVVREAIAASDLGSETCPSLLGLKWDIEKDELSCKSLEDATEVAYTKRAVVKQVSQLFDPSGLVCPVTVLGKIFIQDLWNHGFQWEEILPNDFQARWAKIRRQLADVGSISVPRFVGLPADDNIKSTFFVMLPYVFVPLQRIWAYVQARNESST